MASGSWLTSRFQTLVNVVTPKIATSLLDKSNKLDLATAENHLIRNEVLEVYRETITDCLSHKSLSYPDQLGGEQDLLKAFASFFNRYFRPHLAVLPDHIVVGPGVTACLTSMLCSICDPGDVILVPGSYWSGFDLHLKLLPAVQLVNVALDEPGQDELGPSIALSLDAAAADLKRDGKNLKALILTNPHNPTGRCYSVDVLKSIGKFCQEHNAHLVIDEIYAMSRCRELHDNTQVFRSFLSLDLQSIGVDIARVHVIWGTSKDFGSSGVRMGCLVSQDNPQVRLSVGMITTTQMSSLATIATAGLLTSPDLPRLIQLNETRLMSAYNQASKWMIARDIRYIPAVNGVYLLARLAPGAKTWQEEEELVRSLNVVGVLVLPGRSFHLKEPGWVRLTIAVEPAVLTEALSQMAKVFQHMSSDMDVQDARGYDHPEAVDIEPKANTENAEIQLKATKRKPGNDRPHNTPAKRLRLPEFK